MFDVNTTYIFIYMEVRGLLVFFSVSALYRENGERDDAKSKAFSFVSWFLSLFKFFLITVEI